MLGLFTAGLGIMEGMYAASSASNAKEKANAASNAIKSIEQRRGEPVNPYAGHANLAGMASDLSSNMTNPMANLGVATQAAEIQAEEADIALANTLDNLRATGSGAGGATALAMAALKSKQGVSANLEQQEVANQKLRAEGQMSVNQLKAEGEKFKFQSQEQREMIELDRAQGLIDKHETQANASQAAMWGAIGNMGNAAMQTGMNVSRIKSGQMGGMGDSGIDKSSQMYQDYMNSEVADFGDQAMSFTDWSNLNYGNTKP